MSYVGFKNSFEDQFVLKRVCHLSVNIRPHHKARDARTWAWALVSRTDWEPFISKGRLWQTIVCNLITKLTNRRLHHALWFLPCLDVTRPHHFSPHAISQWRKLRFPLAFRRPLNMWVLNIHATNVWTFEKIGLSSHIALIKDHFGCSNGAVGYHHSWYWEEIVMGRQWSLWVESETIKDHVARNFGSSCIMLGKVVVQCPNQADKLRISFLVEFFSF